MYIGCGVIITCTLNGDQISQFKNVQLPPVEAASEHEHGSDNQNKICQN